MSEVNLSEYLDPLESADVPPDSNYSDVIEAAIGSFAKAGATSITDLVLSGKGADGSPRDFPVGILAFNERLVQAAVNSHGSESDRATAMKDVDLEPECWDEVTERQAKFWSEKLSMVMVIALWGLFYESMADAIDAVRAERGLNPHKRDDITRLIATAMGTAIRKPEIPAVYWDATSSKLSH